MWHGLYESSNSPVLFQDRRIISLPCDPFFIFVEERNVHLQEEVKVGVWNRILFSVCYGRTCFQVLEWKTVLINKCNYWVSLLNTVYHGTFNHIFSGQVIHIVKSLPSHLLRRSSGPCLPLVTTLHKRYLTTSFVPMGLVDFHHLHSFASLYGPKMSTGTQNKLQKARSLCSK